MKRVGPTTLDSPRQRGTTLVAVLACLAIVLALGANMMQAAVRTRRGLHDERRQRQTELLAEAGLARAAAALARDRSYQGETWRVEGAELGDSEAGAAEIDVKVLQTRRDDEGLIVRVTANYPLDEPRACRRSVAARVSPRSSASREGQ